MFDTDTSWLLGVWTYEHHIGDMYRFFEFYDLSWCASLFFDMFSDNIDSLDEYEVIFWESPKYFCFERDFFISSSICASDDAKSIFPCDNTDSVSGMDFHFFHIS